MFLTGKSSQSGSFKRSLLRPTSPKSPVASASAFESVEGSDDEDNMTGKVKLDTTYLHTNGTVVSVSCTLIKFIFHLIFYIKREVIEVIINFICFSLPTFLMPDLFPWA